MANVPFITLTTDFGTRSHYVASMKAIIYRILPEAQIIDITHNITPHNIYEAAFVLKNVFKYFPVRTTHVVVVDPEVGGDRKPIVVSSANYIFVGPDNGVFTYIYEDLADEGYSVYHMTQSHYFRTEVSPTFHGRDIFAPAAAWLARGTEANEVGEPLESFTKINMPKPSLEGKTLKCVVMHIDSFGNAITNLSRRVFSGIQTQLNATSYQIKVAEKVITDISPSYFALHEKGLGAVFGSTQNLEICMYKKPAYRELGLNLFSPVEVIFA